MGGISERSTSSGGGASFVGGVTFPAEMFTIVPIRLMTAHDRHAADCREVHIVFLTHPADNAVGVRKVGGELQTGIREERPGIEILDPRPCLRLGPVDVIEAVHASHLGTGSHRRRSDPHRESIVRR